MAAVATESSSKTVKSLAAVISCRVLAVGNSDLILENYQNLGGRYKLFKGFLEQSRFVSTPPRSDQKPPNHALGNHKAIHLVWRDGWRGLDINFQDEGPCLEVPRPTQPF